jgi:hypothetical protein
MLPAFAPERNVLFMESYMLTEETGVSSEFNRVLILVSGLLDEVELAFRPLLEINECYAWLHAAVHVPILCYYCFCNIQLFVVQLPTYRLRSRADWLISVYTVPNDRMIVN